MKKIAILALVLVVCLSALGVGYAKWTDDIQIKAKVQTGSVDLVIEEYSGTYVYKNLVTHELEVYGPGPASNTDNLELVASSWAEAGDLDDTVLMTWDNIFPTRFPFKADVIFHYVGTIPAVVESIDCMMRPGSEWILPYLDVKAKVIRSEDQDRVGDIVDIGYQLHYCDYVLLVVTVKLPQDNTLMNRSACGTCTINIAQWANNITPP